jgi:hypothetical protein
MSGAFAGPIGSPVDPHRFNAARQPGGAIAGRSSTKVAPGSGRRPAFERAAEHSGELTGDVETESGAGDAAAGVAVETMKRPKMRSRSRVRDADTLVAHAEADTALARFNRDLDQAAFGRVFDAVVDQPGEDLLDLAGVGFDLERLADADLLE